jgi:hypothetical protein
MRLYLVTLIAVVVPLAAGCGTAHSGSAQTGTAARDSAPFVSNGSVESGPASGYWDDGAAGPSGIETGCIRDRRLAVLITVRNRTGQTIRLLGGGGSQPFRTVIERVAVQVRLATGTALHSWSDRNSPPATIPPGRSARVQSNFLMRDCGSLPRGKAVTINRSITLAYDADGRRGWQPVAVRGARIILTRGPLHPKVPINQVG